MKSATAATIQFTLRDDGIVVGLHVNPDLVRTKKNVSAAYDVLEQLVEGKPRPGLWNLQLARAFPAEAWRTAIRRMDKSVSALAIVADETARQAMGAFPAAIDALLIPTRVVDNEAEAIEWLQQFLDRSESSA